MTTTTKSWVVDDLEAVRDYLQSHNSKDVYGAIRAAVPLPHCGAVTGMFESFISGDQFALHQWCVGHSRGEVLDLANYLVREWS